MPSLNQLMLLLVASILMHVAEAFEEEPDGFRDIEWHTPIEQYEDVMIPFGNSADGETVSYRRTNEKMYIGNIRIEDVLYKFWRRGGFSSSIMYVKRYSCDSFYTTVIERFGRPDQESLMPATDQLRAHWYGAKTHITFSKGQYCVITFASAEIEKELKAFREKNQAETDANRELDTRPDF